MDEERRSKTRLMKIGVILAMALILAFWSFNLRNAWNRNNGSVVSRQNDWQEIRGGLNKSIDDLENRLNQIVQAQKIAEDQANRAFMADLIKNTSALASSTASSTLSAGSTVSASSTLEATADNAASPVQE